MATTTTNYGLKKPAQNDYYNIEDQNGNMDIIDAELKRIEDEIDNIDVTGTQITVDQSQAPTSPGNGTLAQLFSWLANRIKAITGKSNWWEAPAKTLEDLDTHIAQISAHGATSAATANTIIMRDANGRAKVAAPSASDDIANKQYADTKVSKSGDTMTGPLLITTSLPSGVNTADTPDKWPLNGIIQYAVTPGTLQNQPNTYGYIFHMGIANTRYQFFFVWSHPLGGNARAIYYRHAGEGDTSWSQWGQIWHAGNDGAGSGLDADTVDGKHASDFVTTQNVLGYSLIF